MIAVELVHVDDSRKPWGSPRKLIKLEKLLPRKSRKMTKISGSYKVKNRVLDRVARFQRVNEGLGRVLNLSKNNFGPEYDAP